MIIQSLTVGINIILAPVLIAGWGTGHPFGATGAGLASSIASIAGTLLLASRFEAFQSYLVLQLSVVPRWSVWKRIAEIGLPSTAEFSLLFIVSAVVYWSIRRFGADAQAGFGVGSRVSQAIFLPTMAIAFAASPIAGQNYGAEYTDRVRATFRHAALIGSAIMLSLTLLCQLRPDLLILPFTKDPAVTAVAAGYLRWTSWNFVAVGLVFTASGMFQALGNTRPSVVSSGSRLFTFALPSIWLSYQPKVTLEDFWWLSIASVSVQALIALLLLRNEFQKKLKRPARPVVPVEMAIP
jgi:putative MATE family efflux protein